MTTNSGKLELLLEERIKTQSIRNLLTFAGQPLYVRNPKTGQTQGIKIFPSALISNIYVQLHLPLNSCHWNLMFQGRKLVNTATIAESKLSADAEIELIPSSFTDQFLSAFIGSNLEQITSEHGLDMSDCCSWPWVECCASNRTGGKIPIGLRMRRFQTDFRVRNMDVGCLPKTLKTIIINSIGVNSHVDFSQLPNDLEMLELIDNSFSGTLKFSDLPLNLRKIALCKNRFSGVLDFSNIPPNAEIIQLEYNHFFGDLDIRCSVSSKLKELHLEFNRFNGSANLYGLKEKEIYLFMDFSETSKEFGLSFEKSAKENSIGFFVP